MKRIFFIILLLCTVIPVSKKSYAEEYDSQYTLLALNYAIMSIYRVEKYPSRVTVDEEYNGIINNLAIGNISDDLELKNLFKAMMDAYTEDKLTEKDRQLIQRQYEAQVNTAFLKVKPLSHIQTEVGFSTAKEMVAAVRDSGGFWSGLLATSGAAANGLMEYNLALQANERMRMQAQSEENEFMQQRMTSEWALDKEKIRRFNNLKTSLLDAEWTLLRKYNIPDEARLTEDSIDEFYSFISEKDTEKALRSAKRLIHSFSFYPPFWFYYGKTALENGNTELAKSCFNKFFEQSRPILRKDQFIASTARYKIFTLKNNEQNEAKDLLAKIENNSIKDDWNNYLFCALQWYVLGNKAKADELLIRNIDYDFNVSLHQELRNELKNGEININKIQSVIIKQFSQPSQLEELALSGNAEAQFQIGEKLYRKGLEEQAIEWFKKANEQNHFLAKARLVAGSYDKKYGNLSEEAINIFTKLVVMAKDDDNAKIVLAEWYRYGFGTKKDLQKSIDIFSKFAEKNDEYAMLFMSGLSSEKGDKQKGFDWAKKSAELGYASGQYMLSLCYMAGTGVSEDLSKFAQLIQKSAEQNYVYAQLSLGMAYKHGAYGLNKDIEKAKYWYKKASEQGNKFAKQFLKDIDSK